MCTERQWAQRWRAWRGALARGGTCALAWWCIACNGTSSYLDATGSPGHAEASLGIWLGAVAAAVVLAVSVALLAGIARHRNEHNEPWLDALSTSTTLGAAAEGSADDVTSAGTAERPYSARDEHHTNGQPERRQPPGEGRTLDAENAERTPQRRQIASGLRWITIGLGATVVILVATFIGTMTVLDAAAAPNRQPSLTLDVVGHQWWWEVRYRDQRHPEFSFTTANEVHLPIGAPVRVRLRTADVIHSFWLPQLSGKTDLIPGQVNETWVQAEKEGTSRGMCGEYCGLQHATMALVVTTESPERFAAWERERSAEAAAPMTPQARVGAAVFARACGACHAVAGTQALGRMGPDLTHLAARSAIGAGALANTPANLARWIVNAPGVKEGARMPAVPLDQAQLTAVIDYLQTLR